jgi:hypothetical protein
MQFAENFNFSAEPSCAIKPCRDFDLTRQNYAVKSARDDRVSHIAAIDAESRGNAGRRADAFACTARGGTAGCHACALDFSRVRTCPDRSSPVSDATSNTRSGASRAASHSSRRSIACRERAFIACS